MMAVILVSTSHEPLGASFGILPDRARRVCEHGELSNEPIAANVLYLAGTLEFLRAERPDAPGALADAQEHLHKAVKIAQAHDLLALEAKCWTYLAEAEFLAGNLDEADAMSKKAVAKHAAVGAYPNLHYMALVNLAASFTCVD